MATCAKCGSGKLTEQPCPKCGSMANAPDPGERLKARLAKRARPTREDFRDGLTPMLDEKS